MAGKSYVGFGVSKKRKSPLTEVSGKILNNIYYDPKIGYVGTN
jgi:hypothetical protein